VCISLKATWFKKEKKLEEKKEKNYINDVVATSLPFCCFNTSICALMNKLCLNNGTPVDCKQVGACIGIGRIERRECPVLAQDCLSSTVADQAVNEDKSASLPIDKDRKWESFTDI